MKKIISLFLSLVLILSISVIGYADTEEISLNNEFVIITEDEKLMPAAEKLSEYLGNIIGSAPQIKNEIDDSPYILIKTDKAVTDNGYNIKADGKNIIITGSSFPQTVRGIYGFLTEFCSVRCFTSKLIVYGADEIKIPADTDYSYTPPFEYTETDWLSPKDVEYSLFNDINGADYREIPAEMGGSVDYISSFAHTFTNQFCAASKYFDEHPEYFSYSFGKRTPKQLCLTNPDVVKTVTQEVLDMLKEKHDPDADLQIISLTQNDNIAYCKCPECKKADKKYGSHSGTMIEFVNKVARTVKEAGYDNVGIDTFAYQYTRKPPKGIKPEDNVIVRLCSFECCFSHPMDDTSCRANREFVNDLNGWSEICNRVYIWDYCTNFCNFVGIFPNFGSLQRNIQFYLENNVKGIYEEGNYTLNSCDTEFAELRAYLITKLYHDPYCDLEKEKNDFLNAYYGEGGKYIGEFLDIITKSEEAKHLGIYQSMLQTLKLSQSQTKECDSLWEKAKEAATGEAKTNVLNSELCWRFWKMRNHRSEFANIITYSKEKSDLMNEINATGVRLMEVGEVRSFFVQIYQDLYFTIYPVINAVLKMLYAV